MDRGAWRATAHVVAESDTTEQLTLSFSPYVVLCLLSGVKKNPVVLCGVPEFINMLRVQTI